jgi:hypothetical protein
VKGFVDELQKTPHSYSFRDTSRAKSASHQRFTKSGEMLIPGAYELEDFVQESGKKAVTFGFKGVERGKGPKIGHGYGDKVRTYLVCFDVLVFIVVLLQELDISPNMYSLMQATASLNEKGMK